MAVPIPVSVSHLLSGSLPQSSHLGKPVGSLVVCPSVCLSSWDKLPLVTHCSHLGTALSLPGIGCSQDLLPTAAAWELAAFLLLKPLGDPQHFT